MSIKTLKEISETIAVWKREHYDRGSTEFMLDYVQELAQKEIDRKAKKSR